MSEFPSHAEVLADHQHNPISPNPFACECGALFSPQHQDDAWREACTITSIDQVEALPRGTTLLTAGENPVIKSHQDGLWWLPEKERPMPTHLMVGFRVLHHPDWARP